MDKEKFERATRIFSDAVDLRPEQQEAFIASACAGDPELLQEVRSLLEAASGADDFFVRLSEKLGIATDQTEHEAPDLSGHVGRPGMIVGAYTLTEPIGSGGSGTVWRAERTDGQYEARVAIKILRPSAVMTGTGRHLSDEAQHLARLSHPNIARLMDAGVDEDDRPYLVLEYVDGVAVDLHCDAMRLGVRKRVSLFVDILRAVAHAHAHLIVHRDLKPSNVLVDKNGQVKLLDFGIARLLRMGIDGSGQDATLEIGAALTPDYAAPEQLLGKTITTATDVYALGMMLYKLLAGRTPRKTDSIQSFSDLVDAATRYPQKASAVAADADAESRGVSSHALQRTLRGDLDNILQKALAPEPGERYATAAEFAIDLERYLSGDTVSAMPPTLGYRAQKFVRRHRGGVLTTLLTAVALIAALLVATSQMLEAQKQRDSAIYQQQRVQASNEFYSLLLEEMGAGHQSLTAVDLLDRGAELLEEQFDPNQSFMGRIHFDLSKRYSNLRERDRALKLLGRAESAARASEDNDLLGAVLCATGMIVFFSDPERAQDLFEGGSTALANISTPSIDSDVACRRLHGRLAEAGGDRARAITIIVEARDLLKRSPVSATHLKGVTANDLAILYAKDAHYREASEVFEEALALLRSTGRGNTLGYMQVMLNYSSVLGTAGEMTKDIAVKEQLLQRLENANWADERASLPYRASYAAALVRLSRFDEAIAILLPVRDQARDLGSQMNIARSELSLAGAFAALGRHQDADASLSAVEKLIENNPATWDFQIAKINLIRAQMARNSGQLDKGRSLVKQIMDDHDYPNTNTIRRSLSLAIREAALIELAAENYAKAESLASDMLQSQEAVAVNPDTSADVGGALYLRARARIGLGRTKQAIGDLERSVASLANGLGETNPETVDARNLLAEQQAHLRHTSPARDKGSKPGALRY